jgi:hypothetical protein
MRRILSYHENINDRMAVVAAEGVAEVYGLPLPVVA